MIFDPIRGRTQGVVLAAAAVLAGACNDPEQNSDLRPSGPPEVLTVLVMNDPVAMLGEQATYCKPDDEKRPAQVGLPDFTISTVCDPDLAVAAEPVTDAYPDGWYVRIMFDELLDPNIEELTEILDENGAGTDTFTGSIANTQPVTLQCESIGGGFVDVPYDGYYSPAGNRESWPLGPSLVIKPNDPTVVATGKNCRVTLNDNVVDKNGEAVPAEQRGPFEFRLATVQPIFSAPADGDEISPLAVYFDNVYVQFNTQIEAASFACDDGVGMDECEFSFGAELDATGLYSYQIGTAEFDDEFGFGPAGAAKENTAYTFSFLEGASVRDRCGQEVAFGAPSVAAGTEIAFTTSAFEFDVTRPKNGDTFAAARRFSLQYTNVIDLDSLAASEYSISPAPEVPVGTDPATSSLFNDGDFLFNGYFAPETQYTFTLNAGATVADANGVVVTQAEPLVVQWTTQPITLSSVTPASGSTVVKADPTEPTRITLTFNTVMDVATLTADDITLTNEAGTAVPVTFSSSGCTASTTSTSCALRIDTAAALAPGDYTFTLKAGAMISDRMATPHVYTQASDRVVEFTVEEAGPAEPPHVCL